MTPKPAALVVLLLVGPGSAAHAAPSTAVMPLHHDGNVTPREAEQLRESMARAVADALPLAEVDRRLGISDPTCVDAACLARAGKLLGTARVLGGRVGRDGEVWSLSLWVFDVERRATLATTRDQCGGCSGQQAHSWSAALALKTLEQARTAERDAGRIEVRSRPAGAEVRIDGQPFGVAGMTFGLDPGPHTVTVTLAHHRPFTKEVEVRAGATVQVAATLEPEATEPTPARGRVLKWVSLGVAAAGLAAGITLIALDGRGTCDASFPGAQCPRRLDTLAGGAVLTALGGGAAVASGYLFYRDAARGRSAAVAPGPVPGGVGLAVTFGY